MIYKNIRFDQQEIVMKSKTKKEILEEYAATLEQKNKMKWMVGQVR